MKIALIHDHLTQEGGAEKVLKVLQEMYPQSPTFTLLYDEKKLPSFKNKKIVTSFLQKMPMALKKYQMYLPLMPTATESYDLMDYDVVISSSSAFAKGVITRTNTLHICYCHTPTRYLWSDTHRYVEELHYNKLVKKFIPPLLTRLRQWDRLAADRVDFFIANSENVAGRIKKYYRRDSTVIFPPVDTSNFYISKITADYYLTGGRLVAYKKFDLVVEAFNHLKIPLKIFGDGPIKDKLEKLAKQNIEFVGTVSDDKLAKLYSEARAFVHPQIEDFGITAVEAMASGRPVIAYQAGGANETVIEAKTGKFFDEQTWESLADAIIRFKSEDYDPYEIKLHAEKFRTERFIKEMNDFISGHWNKLSADKRQVRFL
ncbi:glycosyltransferase family 4 protein [Candidatus Parcubacteria bacterium]|nr:MAG: glycosyltransferase family 4 protein [Candidatus Parcubacteria bacterium]